MNKVILMGRLTRDPEVRYAQGDNAMAIARIMAGMPITGLLISSTVAASKEAMVCPEGKEKSCCLSISRSMTTLKCSSWKS